MTEHILDTEELKRSLKQSAANRAAMKKRFGIIPLSVLNLSRSSLSRQMFVYQREIPERHTTNYKKTREKLERLKKAGYKERITASQRGRTSTGLAATIMPAELVEYFILYYAKQSDLYLDPFFGQGIQMQVAKLMNMRYTGYDCSVEFYEYSKSILEKIGDNDGDIKIFCADSRYPTEIADYSGDFCFTSPPYWDLEYYGDEQEQLGKLSTYDDFLESMYEIAKAWRNKFKSGAYVVINVNDFRKNHKFYPYHADTIKLFQRANYYLHDVWIINGLVGGLPKAFAVDFNNKKIAPKVHEYALVFRVFHDDSNNNA